MKKKGLKRGTLAAQSDRLLAALVRTIPPIEKTPASDDAFSNRSAEAMCVAVLAVLLSDSDSVHQPRDLLGEALALLEASQEYVRGHRVKSIEIPLPLLTLKQAKRALGYTSYGGFWQAVDGTFGAEQALRLKRNKKFDMATLSAIHRHISEGKRIRARKAREAKRRTGSTR